jgi:predicted SAM-dependent methyltransferase
MSAGSLIARLKQTEHPMTRDALLRARGSLHYVQRGHLLRRRALDRYIASTPAPKLQIGSGPVRLAGWLNSDLISGDLYLDLSRPLPLPDASFAYVFGEHVIEHLPERAGAELLAELHRILRPGGVLRLTTPDLRKIIAIYEDRNPVISRDDYARFLDAETGKRHERACQIFNDYTRLWGHRWIYDEEDLAARLREAGFDRVERHEPGDSDHEALQRLERHGGAEWVNRAEAMCIEGTRGH